MSVTLFKSYVLLTVLCFVMILIDNTRSREVIIPGGCKISFETDVKIEFPKKFQVGIPEGIAPRGFLVKTAKSIIANIPKLWPAKFPNGFKVIIPDTMPVPPQGWFDNTPGNCKMTIYDGWTVAINDMWKDITVGDGPEVLIDFFVADEYQGSIDENHPIEISVEAVVHKCTIFLPEDEDVLIPGEFTINLPEKRRRKTADGTIVNLPKGFSVTIHGGCIVGPRPFWLGTPAVGWYEKTADGTIIKLPPSWIVKGVSADNLKKHFRNNPMMRSKM